MPPGPGEIANNPPEWQAVLDGFLSSVEGNDTLSPRSALSEAGRLVVDMLSRELVPSAADLEEYLEQTGAVMRLVAISMKSDKVAPGLVSVDPRDLTRKPYGIGFLITSRRELTQQIFEEQVGDPELNLKHLREAGIVGPAKPTPPPEIAENLSEWQEKVLRLEQTAIERLNGRINPVEVAHYVYTTLAQIVAGGETNWAEMQHFQSRRSTPLFELISVSIEEARPASGVTCRDVATKEPRSRLVMILLLASRLPLDDPRRRALEDHEANLEGLREAGMWFRDGSSE